MYRAMGACPPEAARKPRADPCAFTYVIDLPIIGEEEVEVPVEQLSSDFMSSVVRRLPNHLPQIFQDVEPFVNYVKQGTIRDIDNLVQRTLDRKVRPEIEAQKVQFLADVREEGNRLLVSAMLISMGLVGGLGLLAWYYKK